MKRYLLLFALFITSSPIFSQYTITLLNHQQIPFTDLVIGTTHEPIRSNPRYFLYRVNHRIDSVAVRTIASVTSDDGSKKFDGLYGELIKDCDSLDCGDFYIQNIARDSFDLTISLANGAGENTGSQISLYGDRIYLNYSAGTYSYALTSMRDGKVFQRGSLVVKRCEPNVLVIARKKKSHNPPSKH